MKVLNNECILPKIWIESSVFPLTVGASAESLVTQWVHCAGEAGPVEQCSAEAKSLKTKGQGTVRLPPQWATAEAVRRGARGPNKELLSR